MNIPHRRSVYDTEAGGEEPRTTPPPVSVASFRECEGGPGDDGPGRPARRPRPARAIGCAARSLR